MIRSLQRKFILIAMGSLLGTLVFLCVAIGIGIRYTVTSHADRGIELLYQNNGVFPQPDENVSPADTFQFQVTAESPFEIRYFIVKFSGQQIETVNAEHIAALDQKTIMESVRWIQASDKDQGYVGYYRYKVFEDEEGTSTMIVMDCFRQLQTAYNMIGIMILVSVACVLIVFVLLLFFSKKAIRPFQENLERQCQFVTDASHELKTPLAILSADMGMLEETCGENQWLESARAQVFRMDKLIKNLVELAHTEERVKEELMTHFSVSDVAQASLDAFQPMAERDGKQLCAEITADVYMRGVQDNMFRLFTILLDNAVKYCDAGGTIRFVLSRKGRNIHFSISNPCKGLDTSLLPRYFDRFYRADSSRARATGGYGIGLSTAKAIVERHQGHISNHYADDAITFTAVIPQGG